MADLLACSVGTKIFSENFSRSVLTQKKKKLKFLIFNLAGCIDTCIASNTQYPVCEKKLSYLQIVFLRLTQAIHYQDQNDAYFHTWISFAPPFMKDYVKNRDFCVSIYTCNALDTKKSAVYFYIQDMLPPFITENITKVSCLFCFEKFFKNFSARLFMKQDNHTRMSLSFMLIKIIPLTSSSVQVKISFEVDLNLRFFPHIVLQQSLSLWAQETVSSLTEIAMEMRKQNNDDFKKELFQTKKTFYDSLQKDYYKIFAQ